MLEAAHISPYRGEDDNHVENGLLLRSDIHTLFDLDLLGIDPERLRVVLHQDLVEEYGQFAVVTLGCVGDQRPSQETLRYGTSGSVSGSSGRREAHDWVALLDQSLQQAVARSSGS